MKGWGQPEALPGQELVLEGGETVFQYPECKLMCRGLWSRKNKAGMFMC